jgi:aryl-alcohol dehydrogenase-like predicted oxidoreductase
MEYVKLEQTGLKSVPACLGCMTYGTPEKGWNKWVLHEEQSRPFIQKALELGINCLIPPMSTLKESAKRF